MGACMHAPPPPSLASVGLGEGVPAFWCGVKCGTPHHIK